MALEKGEIGIYGVLKNDTPEGILAYTDQIKDANKNMTLSEINDLIGKDSSIGDYVKIDPHIKLNNSVPGIKSLSLGSHVAFWSSLNIGSTGSYDPAWINWIGCQTVIGSNVNILKNTNIGDGTQIGRQVIIDSDLKYLKDTWPTKNSKALNLSAYVDSGTYYISGERTYYTDNMPISNTGGGHTISGVLHVLDSSLPSSGETYSKCITQILMLSNRVGGQEGDMFIRSGSGPNKDTLTWNMWEKFQTNVEVGVVNDLVLLKTATLLDVVDYTKGMNSFIDNGIYSGVYLPGTSQSPDSPDTETFVMVVINNYAIAGSAKTITQIKFATKNDGTFTTLYRLQKTGNIMWLPWVNLGSLNVPDHIKMSLNSLAQLLIDLYDPSTGNFHRRIQIGGDTSIGGSTSIGYNVKIDSDVWILHSEEYPNTLKMTGNAAGFSIGSSVVIGSNTVIAPTLTITATSIDTFDELWKTAGGTIDKTARNEEGVIAPYQLNGLNLTFEEAKVVYNETAGREAPTNMFANRVLYGKTNFAPSQDHNGDIVLTGFRAPNAVILNLGAISVTKAGAFPQLSIANNLKEIKGLIKFQTTAITIVKGAFYCPALEKVKIQKIGSNITFQNCPKIDLESWTYMIDNAANTAAITITVHADVYAKLTGDTTNEAAAALTEEELAQWVTLNATAVEKQITFATAV